MRTLFLVIVLALVLPFAASGCSSMYYATMEKFGFEKRHILADRVEEGRDNQGEAKERFETTLQAFKGLTSFDGGDLEDRYEDLSEELARCEGVAERVRASVADIDDVAQRMFDEWEDENAEYANASLRSRSEELLADTRGRYARLIGSMREVEARMEPILAAFRDQVRFLKHNLNARAITSLESTFSDIEKDVGELVADMERSIREADAFIRSLDSSES